MKREKVVLYIIYYATTYFLYKALSIPIKLSKYYKEITSEIFRIANYNVILGLP